MSAGPPITDFMLLIIMARKFMVFIFPSEFRIFMYFSSPALRPSSRNIILVAKHASCRPQLSYCACTGVNVLGRGWTLDGWDEDVGGAGILRIFVTTFIFDSTNRSGLVLLRMR